MHPRTTSLAPRREKKWRPETGHPPFLFSVGWPEKGGHFLAATSCANARTQPSQTKNLGRQKIENEYAFCKASLGGGRSVAEKRPRLTPHRRFHRRTACCCLRAMALCCVDKHRRLLPSGGIRRRHSFTKAAREGAKPRFWFISSTQSTMANSARKAFPSVTARRPASLSGASTSSLAESFILSMQGTTSSPHHSFAPDRLLLAFLRYNNGGPVFLPLNKYTTKATLITGKYGLFLMDVLVVCRLISFSTPFKFAFTADNSDAALSIPPAISRSALTQPAGSSLHDWHMDSCIDDCGVHGRCDRKPCR